MRSLLLREDNPLLKAGVNKIRMVLMLAYRFFNYWREANRRMSQIMTYTSHRLTLVACLLLFPCHLLFDKRFFKQVKYCITLRSTSERLCASPVTSRLPIGPIQLLQFQIYTFYLSPYQHLSLPKLPPSGCIDLKIRST